FADEPTGNLDAENGQHIVDLLVSMNRERQTTLVLVTHDRAVASCAQQIVRLEGGKLVRDSQ
ncbi:MAG: ABC transporter, partial [Gemmatimonadales bacterium]